MSSQACHIEALRSAADPQPRQYFTTRHWIVIFAFLLSRVLYFAAGLRFNTLPIGTFWQFIDPLLLRTDFLRSIWYLHMQPPLFNFLIGLTLNIFPQDYSYVLQTLYLLIGFLICINLLGLMNWLGISAFWSCALTILFIASPPTLLYENLATYDYPVCCLMLLASVTLIRLVEKPTARTSFAFFGCLAALALIRSLYHLVFLVMTAALILLLLPRPSRKHILSGALFPLILVGAVYVKNELIFHRFAASTWDGMQIGSVTADQLTASEARTLIEQHLVSPVSGIRSFRSLNVYLPYLDSPPLKTGIPVLDNSVTSTGAANFNALGYLEVHRLYAVDAIRILRYRPIALVRSLASAWFCYFRPASDLPYYFLDEVKPIQRWERVFSAMASGQFRRSEKHEEISALLFSGHAFAAISYTGVWLVVILPVISGWLLIQLCHRASMSRWSYKQRIVMSFCLFNIVLVTLTGTFLSHSETNRYRFSLDPYFLTFTGMMLTRLTAWFKKVDFMSNAKQVRPGLDR